MYFLTVIFCFKDREMLPERAWERKNTRLYKYQKYPK